MKEDIREILDNFLKQAKTDNLKTSDYPRYYSDLILKVSFGQGTPARIPWISFLGNNQKTSQGIYPVYHYHKKIDKLILAYGISETYKPKISWNLPKDSQKIKDYFESLGTKPERYGDSFVFNVYNTQSPLDWNQIENDLSQIIREYKEVLQRNGQNTGDSGQSIELDLQKIKADVKSSGFQMNDSLLERFVCALLTKPFVILTGLSGSGKTKLAQILAKYICENDSQYKMIPVGADWTNREPLLGFPNALEPGKYVWPENGALSLLLEAKANPNKPYFLILDEMNLSHVERYFADFLSAMESGEPISIHPDTDEWKNKDNTWKDDLEPFIQLPDNLFIVGTVNVDETTYMFSPKVLDRAQVLEFRVSDKDMASYLENQKSLDINGIGGLGSFMAESFLSYSRNSDKETDPEYNKLIKNTLISFFNELKKSEAEFGFRSASEIYRFLTIYEVLVPEADVYHMMDSAIMQKLLPRVHGSRRKLEPVLRTLGQLCVQEGQNIDEVFNIQEDFDFNDTTKVKYPMSLEKIVRMYTDLIYNGFTSYAEA
jgi:5-methylcytosine-specific restriction protein B